MYVAGGELVPDVAGIDVHLLWFGETGGPAGHSIQDRGLFGSLWHGRLGAGLCAFGGVCAPLRL